MSQQTSPKLILNKEDIKKNTIALFNEIKSNSKSKASFIKNPVGLLSEKVFKRDTSKQEISDSNRLLFSILANDKFLKWLNDYSKNNKKVSREEYAANLIQAAVKFGDKNIIASISKYATDTSSIPGLGPVAEQLLINNAAGSIAATPVAQPSTSDQSAKSIQNFNGIGFGNLGVLLDPAFIRSVIETLVERAKELSKGGKLSNLKTQII